MKPWLTRLMLPLVMLDIVVVCARPAVGAIGIATSVVVFRLFNGPVKLPEQDELPQPYFRAPKRL